jgi:hypothetical protein
MEISISDGLDYVNQNFLDVFNRSKSLLGPAINNVNAFFEPVINGTRDCFVKA